MCGAVSEDLSGERARLEEWRLELEKQYRIQKHEQEVRGRDEVLNSVTLTSPV